MHRFISLSYEVLANCTYNGFKTKMLVISGLKAPFGITFKVDIDFLLSLLGSTRC